MHLARLSLIGGCGLMAAALCGRGEPAGPADLHRLDRLPHFKDSVHVGSVSSYDRTGGNDDGFSGKFSFVRKDPQGLVLADLAGPGVITRIWTPTPTDDTLEFLFDGEAEAHLQVRFRDLFLGSQPGFPRPLVGFGAGGCYCYVPIPFAKSCVVRLRASKVQFYQINFARYAPSTPVATFSPRQQDARRAELDRAGMLWASAGSDVSSFSAPPGARLDISRRAISLAPGAAQAIFERKEPGRIVGLRMGPASAIAGKARDLSLRISCDGEAPAVWVPLGDFFGYAWGQPAARALLVGTSGETNYCYFPMPFDQSATVEIVSERAAPVDLWGEVVHTAIGRAPDEGKFYALWRRENPSKIGEPYTFIHTQGRGHLAGVVLQSQGFEPGKTLYFEGDDQTTIDGELAIHGTGSEDFFNGGWYDVPDRWEKRISFPLSGCLGYQKHLGRTGAYRLFLADAYPYRESLLQTIEHGGEKNSIPTDYCSVSYFYSERRPTASLEPVPLDDRTVSDPREVVFPMWWQTPIHAWSYDRASLTRKKETIAGEEVRSLSLAAAGSDWFGPHFLSPTVEVPSAGAYSIYIEAVQGPDQAVVQLFQNESPAGDPVDLYAAKPSKSGRLLLGRIDLAEGRNNLMLKLVGKNDRASGLGLSLIQIACVRQEASGVASKYLTYETDGDETECAARPLGVRSCCGERPGLATEMKT
ncbi:MAG TPA: DUF2961 domain-containing protein [Candidatus Paceibacterota bacterium]|nr:DUF2961 domain-containing protein [Verrucomicrobiota bacterium]HRZ46323.1 DUF2961 domain-containing protein [Candidatus Paceibacterota bacterium]HRZ57094.1 DUF2961 domain-containing protein [Candidatus Paceibacterota bacterium]